MLPRLLLVLLLFLLPACTQSQPTPATSAQPLRILFIGNSLTFTNDLPGMLQSIAATESPSLQSDSVTFPGVSLDFHKLTGIAHTKLHAHPWDVVILQDYSTRPREHPEATTASVTWFLTDIRAALASPLLFENWPRRNRWPAASQLFQNYQQIHTTTAIPLAPIGEAWQLARSRLPWFQPYVDDRHPTRIGTYLAACVLFQSIYHHPPTTTFLPRAITPDQATALIQIATQASQ